MTIFSSYKFYLNSPDQFDPDLPLTKLRAKGGTMALWHSSVDQYVTRLQAPSSAVLPILVNLPGYRQSCHICVYLPTAGLDDQFVTALSELDCTLASVIEKFSSSTLIFIKGDMNASAKNKYRHSLVLNLINKYKLTSIPSRHHTYHHLVGINGEFDSILHSMCCSTQIVLK